MLFCCLGRILSALRSESAKAMTNPTGSNPPKTKKASLTRCFFVALEGFEPSQAEPESDVLPLHHKARCENRLLMDVVLPPRRLLSVQRVQIYNLFSFPQIFRGRNFTLPGIFMDFEAESALLWSESGAWRAVDKRGAGGKIPHTENEQGAAPEGAAPCVDMKAGRRADSARKAFY